MASQVLRPLSASMRKDGQVPGRLRPWILRIVQVAVALGLLTLVWQVADGGDAIQILSHAHPVLLLAASALLTLQIFLSALRWQITARPLGIQLRPSVALKEYYLAQIVNQSLPGGVLGDAGRAVRSRTDAGLLASAQAVILERLAGQLGLVFVLAGAFVITWSVPGGLEWPRWLAGAVGVGLLGVLLAPLFLGGLARVLPRRTRDFLQGLGRSARLALTHPSVRWSQLVLSLATALLNITGFVVCAWALGIEASWGASLALVPLVLFTMVVPITVSGWGVREAATVALFPLMGLSPAEGLATSVAFGLVLIVTSLPGLWFLRSHKASKIG